ncbi:ABC transporter substrate-binding protein [Methylosinus sp. 3S-1]|uniref:ABC transporter substrate-binding protein n=2 Tax=Methylocystaceae TaxID=31993 RepID=A0A2D2D2J8_METT3|nr:ABC transporter substrate-binding protein [Methylosinus trichosporium OB3b]
MRLMFRNILTASLLAALCAPAQAADRIRLALQKTGTGAWEIAVVRALGLDKEADLELEVAELASTDAAKIAIQNGAADIVVSDWLWVARQRGDGARLTLSPHSSAIGAVMAKNAAIHSVADLSGKTLGVAGGPLDKAWLLLRAYALRQGVDLTKSATIVYGAPPLIAEKAAQGELDAALVFWNFAVDLEARGLSRVLDMRDVETALGATAAPIVTGYVFDERFAAANGPALARFLAVAAKTKRLIVSSGAAWNIAAAQIRTSDAATLALYRKHYAEGIPSRSLEEERRDAAALYATLAQIGGTALVGRATTLPAGTFYEAASPGVR